MLVAAGKIGGAKYGRLGGRPRIPRAGELAAEQAAEHAEEIVKALRDALDPRHPPQTRVAAAVAWLAIEARADANTNSVPTFDRVSTEGLIDYVTGTLDRMSFLNVGQREAVQLPAITAQSLETRGDPFRRDRSE